MTQRTKLKAKGKPRGRHTMPMLPDTQTPTPVTDGPIGDDVWSIESDGAGRADVERVDEHSPESIDSAAAAPAESATGAVEAEMADPAEAQAPPHLVER